MLSEPVVRRSGGAENSVLLVLTMQVEELAFKLGEPGADARDLADSAKVLRLLLSTPKGLRAGFKEEWLAYLDARLLQTRTGGPSHD